MLKDYLPWIVVGVLLVVVAAALVRTRTAPGAASPRRPGPRPHRGAFRHGAAPPPRRRVGVVVNPTKVADLPGVRERVTLACGALGWDEPRFYQTTPTDSGRGQARQAVRDGADVVCSMGGDGTVRAVASALVGTETPLGILPAGTGNLLARNLDTPMDSIDSAIAVALTGRNRRIDVGELEIGDEDAALAADEAGDQERHTHYFLVMGGMGMDAAIMAGTNESLKRKVGWPAYMVSGVKHLVSPEFRTVISVDGGPAFRRRARAVIIGNCGRLLGGLVLMPDARVDDQLLDVLIAAPKGVVGWLPVITRVLTRRRKGHPTLDHTVCREIEVRSDRPLPVQIDGDVIGTATSLRATLRTASLTVRVSLT
ncbi:MAG TPA: diacylglycerol kinase family protein [Intrasporangium sp.]|uniref:diacylglycerol/lipid kinase family protein n=1 Tax=Intrasporangium sp. TaxID=1925024 RepID=UPI002D793387|nr:diacylglycerol kinase family protein [Intrasporangium sp.]HET7398270.1 diacylglycerol kinase family protein [Intrasporangium sp.]